jgi:predicted nucleotidyltransferase
LKEPLTPFADVNAVLDVLLAGVRAVLGRRLVGMVLFGSLASGDFAPQRSDVDFLVVTDGELDGETLLALEAMHARITASGGKWATKLEGSYIPQHALRRYDPADTWHPALRVDGSFDVDGHGSDWIIQRHVIREQGIALAGPAPQSLIDPVRPDDLRRAALATLREWWAPQLDDHTYLQSREYQAYAALTMCRALYTLERGAVVSKPFAAGWVQEMTGERWAALIERALAWPREPQPDNLNETLDLIRYTLERSRQFEIPTDEA